MFNGMNVQGIPGMRGVHHPGVNIFRNGQPGNFHTQFHFSNQMETIVKKLTLTLEQCYNGCVYPIDIERYIMVNTEKTIEKETIYVNIPAGINENETVILHDKGNIINSRKGPVHIQITLIKHDSYIRDGLDITYNKTISLKESLCGFRIEILHLSGKRFAINNSGNTSVIQPNYRKVVPGYGMKRDNNVGNLIIIFNVEFPTTLTNEQIQVLQNVLP